MKGSIVKTSPYTACGPVDNAVEIKGRIALALRGDCMFAVKARMLQEAGAIGAIFIGEEQKFNFFPTMLHSVLCICINAQSLDSRQF